MLIEIIWESNKSRETPCSNKGLSDKVNLSRVVKIDIPLLVETHRPNYVWVNVQSRRLKFLCGPTILEPFGTQNAKHTRIRTKELCRKAFAK